MTPRKPKRAKGLGVSDAEYARLLAAQGGHCALCPNTPKTRRLHTDHDHATDKVRGLLCYVCNKYLPATRDAEWHMRAAFYLDSGVARRVWRKELERQIDKPRVIPPGLPPLATIGGTEGQARLYREATGK